jgi:Fe-S cluster assembly scaffold protein SufB
VNDEAKHQLEFDYSRYGFWDPIEYLIQFPKGLSKETVIAISKLKNEPKWMLELRLKAYQYFTRLPMPKWGPDLKSINFDSITYYVSPTDKKARSWEEVPSYIKKTFDRLGIPEAERRFLAGVGAQYDSEVVYHSIKEELEKEGVIFLDTDTGLKEYPQIFKKYFGTVVPPNDNKFAALNSAVWSGGSFIYVPRNVKVKMPLQAYFRINAQAMGQFERTLIVVEPYAEVTYIEGCTAPVYASDSLHAAVVEIIAKENSKVTYITVQNWSRNVYNLVTKRAHAYKNAYVKWIDGNIGCLVAGTKIHINSGTKNIEDINVGDIVYSLTPDFRIVKKRVVAKKENPPSKVFKLVTSNDRKIEATANHPFLVLNRKEGYGVAWKRLSEIDTGEHIAVLRSIPYHDSDDLNTHHESLIVFDKVKEIIPAGVKKTYDIEVEELANFIANGIFVHNSKITMKYPGIFLKGEGSRGEVLSIAYASSGQHIDSGAKIIHLAPNTTSRIINKSVCKDGGRTTYRGLIHVPKGIRGVKSNVVCDALILDDKSQTDTYPYIEIRDEVDITHEAKVGKVGEDQVFYLMSRGLEESEALNMIVMGFIEEFIKELPFEYAIEFNRLIQLDMEGAIG